MALVRAAAMFKLFPGKHVHRQKVKLRPIEHHYEEEGEEPYVKYSCQLCEQLADNVKGFHFEDENGNDAKFTRFSFPEGTERCPCCGVYIDWDYKKTTQKAD